MSDRWRCFVAIPISAGLRHALESATAGWRAATTSADLRWMDPDAWHVTVAFLGDVDAAHIPDLIVRLPALVAFDQAVELIPDGIVSWPRADGARMVWCRFRPEAGIGELHNRVAAALAATERRRYRPHVTLARVRGGRTLAFSPSAPTPPDAIPTTRVDEVIFYRSHLDPAGTTYEPLARVGMSAVPA